MSKIAIFFGPRNGSVHRVANKLQDAIGADKVEMIPVNSARAEDLNRFDKIIFGISTIGKDTWDASGVKTDWAKFLPEIGKANYKGKTIAIFGLGDHITYGKTFVNHIAVLARDLTKNDAELVGMVSEEGYEYESSTAVVDGKFLGLPLDEDFEPELTDERLENWLKQIQPHFGF